MGVLLQRFLRRLDLAELEPASAPPADPRDDVADGRLPVSVVIPAYNREALVARAVRSVLAQRPWPPAEILVVDDASTDATAAVAQELGATVVRHDANRGAFAARATGIAAARSPWIAMLDSDDEWLPDHLATLWPYHRAAALVAGWGVKENRDGTTRVMGVPLRRPLRVRSPKPLVFPENFIAPSAALVRREVLAEARTGALPVRYAEDMQHWLHVLARHEAIVLPKPVLRYHEHPGQKSLQRDAAREDHYAIFRGLPDRPWTGPQVEARGVVYAWDDLRSRLWERRRAAALRDAVRILRRPSGAVRLLELLAWRALQRRLGHGWTLDGRARVALLDTPPAALAPAAGDRIAVDDLGAGGVAAQLVRLARRPPALAVARSRVRRAAARAVGVRAAGPDGWRAALGA